MKYTFYNIKDENFKIVSVNGVTEFPKNFANSLAVLLGKHHSICVSSIKNTKSDFSNKIFNFENN